MFIWVGTQNEVYINYQIFAFSQIPLFAVSILAIRGPNNCDHHPYWREKVSRIRGFNTTDTYFVFKIKILKADESLVSQTYRPVFLQPMINAAGVTIGRTNLLDVLNNSYLLYSHTKVLSIIMDSVFMVHFRNLSAQVRSFLLYYLWNIKSTNTSLVNNEHILESYTVIGTKYWGK